MSMNSVLPSAYYSTPNSKIFPSILKYEKYDKIYSHNSSSKRSRKNPFGVNLYINQYFMFK